MGNASTPSIFIIPRNNSADIEIVYDGACIKKSQLSMNADGSITVTTTAATHCYYRLFDMERTA